MANLTNQLNKKLINVFFLVTKDDFNYENLIKMIKYNLEANSIIVDNFNSFEGAFKYYFENIINRDSDYFYCDPITFSHIRYVENRLAPKNI